MILFSFYAVMCLEGALVAALLWVIANHLESITHSISHVRRNEVFPPRPKSGGRK